MPVALDSTEVCSGGVCSGDVAAHGDVFRRHSGQVAVAARWAGADGHSVDDVVQDTFLSLWSRPGRFDPERGNLDSFLGAIVRSRVIDIRRSDVSRRRRESVVGAGEQPGVEDGVVATLAAVRLRQALATLPAPERHAIELAYFGGRTYRQVAVEVGEPEGTVKSRIRAGLRRLRSELADELV